MTAFGQDCCAPAPPHDACNGGPGGYPAPCQAASDPLVAVMAAVAAGDRCAFRQLYDATSARLFGLAMLLLRRRDAAEDVVQEAYLRIWARAGRYDPERGPPLPWMAQFLRHAALDRRRRDGVPHEDIDEHSDRLPAILAAIGDSVDVTRCLAVLPAAQRQVLLLAYLHGYTNDEIAARLCTPVGTVKSWVRRGSARVRVALSA